MQEPLYTANQRAEKLVESSGRIDYEDLLNSEIDTKSSKVNNIVCRSTNSEPGNIQKQLYQFKRGLTSFQPYLDTLNIGPEFKHYYILEAFSVFPNLKNLNISCNIIPLSPLSKVLNQLTYLESLNLSSNYFIIFNDEEDLDTQINLPNSLKSLHISDCILLTAETSETPETSMPLDYSSIRTTFHDYFNLPPQHLPNLKNFTYRNINREAAPIVSEFLALNPTITNLSTHTGSFSHPTARILEQCQNLQHLSLESDFSNIEQLTRFRIPELPNITSIKFNYTYKEEFLFLANLCLNCPNLTDLELNYKPYCKAMINSLLSQLPGLKSLTLTNDCIQGFQLDLSSLPELEQVKVDVRSIDFIDLKKFENSKKLRNITLIPRLQKSNVKHNLEERFNNWSVINYDGKVQCYKN
jgi:hypothetical protein